MTGVDASAAGLARFCAHCGLPVAAVSSPGAGENLFCCHACRMVAAIVGRREGGEHAWNLLRLGLGTLLAMNVMMVSLLLYTGSVEPESVSFFRMLLLGLATPALALLVPPFVSGAFREIASGKGNLDFLIALGSLSAYSVSAFHALRGSGSVYFDTATMLPVLVTAGKIVEASAKRRAADLLRTLETLLPEKALLVAPNGTREVPLALLSPGDLVRIRPGERVPVDGSVLEGESSIAEAPFTGEFVPRCCRPGDNVIAGTVNGTGTLLVRTAATGSDLLLHRIVAMVQDAWATPSKGERIAQKAAAFFLPAVLIIAADTAVYWSLFGSPDEAMLNALSVLVVACPCTMGIATPLATSLAVARAAGSGIVVRGGSVMEGIAATDVVFFDKTGTLTEGFPKPTEIRPAAGVAEEELLGRVAALESASEHALGRGVLERALREGVTIGEAVEVEVFPGGGITGTVTWGGVSRRVAAGSPSFVGTAEPPADAEESSIVDVCWDGIPRGRLLLADTLRPEAADCMEGLLGLRVASVLLSGDRFPAAAAVARRTGIDRVEAQRSPAQKLETIRAEREAGKRVAMVGDGINDAPSLAAADTGMALGGGTELARLAGNVVLLSADLARIPWLIRLARKTAAIVRGNFAWSFAYNLAALAAAAAGLLHPLLAALAMVLSSLTVLCNSLRITAFPDPPPPPPDAAAP